MEKTNKAALVAIGIDSVINFEDASFQTQLLQTTSAITTVRNKTPEHNYLIGLAYLNGIDVEVDREYGLMLISSAAQAEFIPAMYTLQQIYEKGIAAKVDCQKSLKIAENIVVHCTEHDGNDHPKTYKAKGALAESHNLCGLISFVSSQYEPAKLHFKSSIQIYEELIKKSQLAASYYQKGVKAFEKFKDDSEEDKVFLMASYIKAALLYVSINHTIEAKIHFFEAINLGKSLSDNHSKIYGHSMLMCYNELAVIYNSCDDTQNAEFYFLEAIEINETFAELYPEEFAPELIVSYNNIIIFYREHNKMEKATPYYPKILKLLNL